MSTFFAAPAKMPHAMSRWSRMIGENDDRCNAFVMWRTAITIALRMISAVMRSQR